MGFAQDNAPLSAINWLSESAEPSRVIEPEITDTAATPQITVTPLARPSKDSVGLLPPAVTGLPRTIWAESREPTLVELVRAEKIETLPAIQDFLKVLMLAEADAPLGASSEGALFLARVDKLLDLGALEPAQSLIEQADPDTVALFRRWFDVALLTGTEDVVCNVMGDKPSVAPTYPARIFCLARNGNWPVAALTLNTHRALGDITENEDQLLARFLDPELFEGADPLDPPTRVTPLFFRMHEAIGEPLITATLPLAFSHADLRSTTAWKAQIEAAERLSRFGSISENVLQRVYTARTPAASGGVWDRAAAFQRFDVAISASDPAAVSRTLPPVWNAMIDARTEVPFAKLYGAVLQELPLDGRAAEIAFRVGLLSPDYETVALTAAETEQRFDPFLIALARGLPQDATATTAQEIAVRSAFDGALPSPAMQLLLTEGKIGEALLRAIAQFNEGYGGDLRSVTQSLALMRAVGLEDVARRAALQLMILDRAA